MLCFEMELIVTSAMERLCLKSKLNYVSDAKKFGNTQMPRLARICLGKASSW